MRHTVTDPGYAYEDEAIKGSPRHSVDAEGLCLAACMHDIEGETFDEVAKYLREAHFFRDVNQLCWRAMVKLREQGFNVAPPTVADALKEMGHERRFGAFPGAALKYTISDLYGSMPPGTDAHHFARKVLRLARYRDLRETALALISDCEERSGLEPDEIEHRLANRLDKVAIREPGSRSHYVPDRCRQELEEIRRLQEQGREETPGTGIPEIDGRLGGFAPGELILIAARPSMGKSALGLNAAEHCASVFGDVVYISLEMSAKSLLHRLYSSVSRVDISKISGHKRMTPFDMQCLEESSERLQNIDLHIEEPGGCSLTTVVTIVRKHALKRRCHAVVIDYLQLIAGEQDDARIPRHEQVAKMSRRLKLLAVELNIPIVALSQLNRSSEARADKRPFLGDLRESGALEQDADKVLLIHRPDYYDPENKPGIAEIHVVKNRNGEQFGTEVVFVKHCCRFESLARTPEPDRASPFAFA